MTESQEAPQKVIVVDYGAGNVHSVLKAIAHEGGEGKLSANAEEIREAERLVLPGVGAFGDGMRGLRERGLIDPIRSFAKTGRPLLGICLGMQMLLDESTEFGTHEGLGIIPGTVDRIPVDASSFKIPHVGWNTLVVPAPARSWKSTYLEGLEDPMMYFVHSFHAKTKDPAHTLANVHYGDALLCAAVQRDNVVGFQFHPEKSGPLGLRIVRRFLSAG